MMRTDDVIVTKAGGRRAYRQARIFPEIVMTTRGYANPAWVRSKKDRIRGFVHTNPDGYLEFWQESHPDYCDICGNSVDRSTAVCRNGHRSKALRELEEKGSPYQGEER